MKSPRVFLIAGVIVAIFAVAYISLSHSDQNDTQNSLSRSIDMATAELTGSGNEVVVSERIDLPLVGSAPTSNVAHTIDISDIRQGCFVQDCIPSVDDPQFVSVQEADEVLPEGSIGIALSYKGVERFYPFPMLETKEIVNDTVAGDPLLITYCPLCGTGIVFDRNVNGVVQEFGVSGMLWQSNLLMYNRADAIDDRNLWSQVLGQAVVGNQAGVELQIIPSDIARFSDWKEAHPDGEVLFTGQPRDPYRGDYYGVASRFAPNFDANNSPLPPMAYVYGIEVNGVFKAYPRDTLPTGQTEDVVAGQTISVKKSAEGVTFLTAGGEILPDVEGFWFSWVAAHPNTELWN